MDNARKIKRIMIKSIEYIDKFEEIKYDDLVKRILFCLLKVHQIILN
jgi:hypothetical protein